MFLSPSEYLPVSRFLCLSFCFSEHHCFWVSVCVYPQLSESLVSGLAVSLGSFGSLSPSFPVSRSLSGLPIPGSMCLCHPLGSAPLGPRPSPPPPQELSPPGSLTASWLLSVLLPSPTSSSSFACCSAPWPLGSSAGASGASGSRESLGCPWGLEAP